MNFAEPLDLMKQIDLCGDAVFHPLIIVGCFRQFKAECRTHLPLIRHVLCGNNPT